MCYECLTWFAWFAFYVTAFLMSAFIIIDHAVYNSNKKAFVKMRKWWPNY